MPSSPAELPVLQVTNLSKAFALYSKPSDRLLEALTGRERHVVHQAIDRLNLSLMPGEAVGLIGPNGAGKSTLLKLISGVLEPDEGRIEATGRITGLLELGTGFDPELTGRDNIRLNARLLGLSESEIRAMEAEVIAFAELGESIDRPVRTYSSGMAMRLGFSTAFHVRPAAFIVDEALSVGDARFQHKCIKKIQDYLAQGGALLFVSHDLNAVRRLCSRVLVLNAGRVVFEGAAREAVQAYYELLSLKPDEQPTEALGQRPEGYGTGEARIAALHWRAPLPARQAQSGDTLTLELEIQSQIDLAHASVGVLIRDRMGQDLFGVNTAMLGEGVHLKAGATTRLAFEISLALGPGAYSVTVAIHTDETHHDHCLHWWDEALSFEVTGFAGPRFSGLVGLAHSVRLLP